MQQMQTALAQKSNCLSLPCSRQEAGWPIVPKEVAAKYKGDKVPNAKLIEKVKKAQWRMGRNPDAAERRC